MTQVFDELPGGREIREERVDWEKVKADMIANEGQWVKVENVASSITQQLGSGRNQNFRGDELRHFEFVTRRTPGQEYAPRRTDLYGRYTQKPVR